MSNPIDIQNAIALLHGEGYKIEPPESKIKFAYYGGDYNYSIKWGKPIDKEDFPKIEEAISKVLNGELDTEDESQKQTSESWEGIVDWLNEHGLSEYKWGYPVSPYQRIINFLKEKFDHTLYLEQTLDANQDKVYSQSEVDTIRKEAFESGRNMFKITTHGEPEFKYPTLQDYLNSLNGEDKSPKKILSDAIMANKYMDEKYGAKSTETLTNTVTDNSDVVCLSLNDCSKWYEAWYPNNPMKEAFLFGLSQIVKQKLNL